MEHQRLDKYRCERFVEELAHYVAVKWKFDPFDANAIYANIEKEAMLATGLDTSGEVTPLHDMYLAFSKARVCD